MPDSLVGPNDANGLSEDYFLWTALVKWLDLQRRITARWNINREASPLQRRLGLLRAPIEPR